jgi:hypothetical protein
VIQFGRPTIPGLVGRTIFYVKFALSFESKIACLVFRRLIAGRTCFSHPAFVLEDRMFRQKRISAILICYPLLAFGLDARTEAQQPRTSLIPIPAAQAELLSQEPPDWGQYQRQKESLARKFSEHEIGIDETQLVIVSRSPNGKRVALAQSRGIGTGWVVALDGKEGPEFEKVSRPVFSPDGSRLACVVGHGDGSFFRQTGAQARRKVIADNHEGKEYDCLNIALLFSPNGDHLIYTVLAGDNDKKSIVVIDGQEGKSYDDVFAWQAILVNDPTSRYVFHYLARDGTKFFHIAQPLP